MDMPTSYEDVTQCETYRQRYEPVYLKYAEHAPEALPQESPRGYRIRLMRRLMEMAFGNANAAADFTGLENPDAQEAALLNVAADSAPADGSIPGKMVATTYRDDAGRKVTEYHGDSLTWMNQFAGPRFIGNINLMAGKVWVPGKWVNGNKGAAR
jgi:hypothetical protein